MTEIEKVKARMFGPGSLEVKNIGFTLGARNDITAEDIARELNRALDQLEAGDFEDVTNSMFTRKRATEAKITLRG